MVLGTLFRNISSPDEIDAVFMAFDGVRRDRCQQIIHSSKGTGQIFCGQNKEVGLNLDKFRQVLGSRWDCIDAIDHEIHMKDALCKLRDILTK